MSAEVKWIKITTNMFEHDKFDFIYTLPEADAIIVIWVRLLAQAGKCNAGGYVMLTENIPYTDDMLASKFKKPINIVRLALDTFARLRMIERFEEGIYISNWDKHQNVDGMEKIKLQTNNRVRKYRENKRLQLIGDCNVTGNATSNVTVTECNATDIEVDIEEEIDKEREKELIKKNPRQKYDEDSPPYRMAVYLLSRIREWTNRAEQPNMQQWADDCRKILEIDKRDKGLVRDVIDWATKDTFWQGNILSPGKLRKQFTTLCVHMDKDRDKGVTVQKKGSSGKPVLPMVKPKDDDAPMTAEEIELVRQKALRLEAQRRNNP
ncbi:phage replisome organizer N-terminal domain-containing protein [Paenibacillus sp. MBLB4367]|uniref:phage replisome organizer N-terminal domain-containing protein n=1 Tax=Paenibacillus sp. MBLB4367 TaxID=3384767 RepID=UPI0039083ABC